MAYLLNRQPTENVAVEIVYDVLSARPYPQVMVSTNALSQPDKEWIIESSDIKVQQSQPCGSIYTNTDYIFSSDEPQLAEILSLNGEALEEFPRHKVFGHAFLTYTLGMGLRDFTWRLYFGAQPAKFVEFLLGYPPSSTGKFEPIRITKICQRSNIAKSFAAVITQWEGDANELPGTPEILQECSKRFDFAKQGISHVYFTYDCMYSVQ
ncbi:hypothetical protein AOQ84DRAFT_375890 [Glonium stellatum]|uniref:Uncharacterized protein n=1 Tax=Glonium stellatum TaxID=574774 RepID=A0A8E2JTT9_9PEZI|nr:hypothetical protein AOQ84DRAFT_375890 [Glonium stellatum]